jgi:hypothetical protein
VRKFALATQFVLTAFGGASFVNAAFVQVNPYSNIAGTGTVTGNQTGGNAQSWSDMRVSNSNFRGPLPISPMVRDERFATPQTFGTVWLDGNSRAFAGQLFFDVNDDGTFETSGPTFSAPVYGTVRVDAGGVTAQRIRVQIDSTGISDYHQVGDVEINTLALPNNLALLPNTTQRDGGSAPDWGTGSIHDDLLGHANSEWRSDPTKTSNFIGMTFDDGPRRVGSLRIATSTPHGTKFVWEQFHVQTLIAGTDWTNPLNWIDQGIAQVPLDGNGMAIQDLVWINFTSPLLISGVRLFGSDLDNTNGNFDGSNTDPAFRDAIVDEIAVFAPLPEPGSLGILAIAAAGALSARRRGARC